MGEKLFLFRLFVSLVRVFVKTHSDRCLFTCQGAFPLCRHDGLYKCTDSFRILRIYIVYASDQIKMLCFHFFCLICFDYDIRSLANRRAVPTSFNMEKNLCDTRLLQ